MTTGKKSRSFERIDPGQTFLVVTDSTLPKAGSDNPAFGVMGLVFGEVCVEDPLFRSCTLPEGWTVERVGDDGSYLLDTNRNQRAFIIYRNMAGMREADISPLRRFSLNLQHRDGKYRGFARDRGQVIYATTPYIDEMDAVAVSQGFLDEHWPKWVGYDAYWD